MYGAIKRLIPVFVKDLIKDPVATLRELSKSLGGMVPPRSMMFIGEGDFLAVGEEFKNYFVQLAGLKPDAKVLDVGCGIGRMAVPLTAYLSEKGEYWGFDIVRRNIEWCQRRITPRFKNFHFQYSDVYNKHYNPDGVVQPKQYKFPFQDGTFDFVFLTSVFTHMLPEDLENYLSEVARVLKNDGKCLITFFLLNQESKRLVREGKSRLNFQFEMDGYVTTDRDVPEEATGYEEEVVRKFIAKYNLVPTLPVQYGSWCGRESFLSFQDIVITVKRPGPTL